MAESESKTDDKVKQQPSEKAEEPTFHRDDLVARAPEYFGAPSHIVAGALAGSKKNFTLDEGKKAISDWLRRPVEVEDRLKPADERKA